MSTKGDFLKKKKNYPPRMVFALALHKSHPALLYASLSSITPKDFIIPQNQKQSTCMSWKTALKTPYNIIHGVPPAHSFTFSVLGVQYINLFTCFLCLSLLYPKTNALLFFKMGEVLSHVG
jgi:hypothetical protein